MNQHFFLISYMSFSQNDTAADILAKTEIQKKFVWQRKINKLRKQGLTKEQILERDKIQRQEDAAVFILITSFQRSLL